MIIKVRTESLSTWKDSEKTKFRYSFLLYDNVNKLKFVNKAFRIETKAEMMKILNDAIASNKDIIRVFSNGDPDKWDYSIPFPYNVISFNSSEGQKVDIYFNTEVYICNDKGDTLEKIYGY